MKRLGELFTPRHWRLAAVGVPGIALILFVGRQMTDPYHAAVAAGAAFSVGFGLSRDLGGMRWGAMAAAMLGMSVSGALGTLVGQWFPLSALVSALLAAVCAALALRNEDLWWVALQLVIAFMMAGYFPGGVNVAMERALAVLIGGTTEIIVAIGVASLFTRPVQRLPLALGEPPQPGITTAHACRAAAAVLISLTVARMIGLTFDYWAPITALIVLKPGLHDTRARGGARLLGTASGSLLAIAWGLGFADNHHALALGAVVAIALSYTLQKASYEIFSACVTMSVVFLVSIGQGGPVINSEHRLFATVIGGLVALLVSAPLPHRLRDDDARDRMGKLPKL